MLIGIVKKNAIMQIDFALEAERQHGKTPADAIYEGCLIRFRPIMMTTMAALLGAVPIALGYGAGGEARRPLGLAVVGGLRRVAADHAVSDAGRLHLHGGIVKTRRIARHRVARHSALAESRTAGVRYNVMSCDTSSPPTTARPSGRRASPPAPETEHNRQPAEKRRHRGHHDGRIRMRQPS